MIYLAETKPYKTMDRPNKRCKNTNTELQTPDPFHVGDINSEILGYVENDNFLFYSTVCKAWSYSWMDSPRDTKTDVGSGDSSISQIKECVELGIETMTLPMLTTVARTGELDLLKTMCSRLGSPVEDGRVLTAAVSSGNMEMVEWLYGNQKCSTAFDPLDAAASRGDVSMYRWLRERESTRNFLTASKAAGNGHLDMIKAIRSDECDDGFGVGFLVGEYDEAIRSALKNNHVQVIEWLRITGVLI